MFKKATRTPAKVAFKSTGVGGAPKKGSAALTSRSFDTSELARQFMNYGLLDLYVGALRSDFIRHQNFWLMQGVEKIGKGLLILLQHGTAKQVPESQMESWLKSYSHNLQKILTAIDSLSSAGIWSFLASKTTQLNSSQSVDGQEIIKLFSKEAFHESRYPSLDRILHRYPISGSPNQYYDLMADSFVISVVEEVSKRIFATVRSNYLGQFSDLKTLKTNRIQSQDWKDFTDRFIGRNPL